MKYRGELEALNALIVEQKRTNELLEQLLTQKTTAQEPINHIKRPYTRRAKNDAS
ncbi:hypothetical protein [Paenibacillus oleatilyticus]|uniref:Transposase n=1 Tax=Paenibacillus oleatilyticus TaxID=2594886 RepID=A0ABV4VCG4_9BACL